MMPPMSYAMTYRYPSGAVAPLVPHDDVTGNPVAPGPNLVF